MAKLALFTIFFAVAAGLYQFYVQPILKIWGFGRLLNSRGNTQCTTVPELQACEKLSLTQGGLLYLACSTPDKRAHWTPTMGHLNASGHPGDDYVALYDPKTSAFVRLEIEGYNSDRGLSLHGMSVVPSSGDPSQLFVYLVNHRKPLHGDAKVVGSDSVIEIFTTNIGKTALTHVRTVEDPAIATPNDVVGAPDGKSFYFTNDHGSMKTGLKRELHLLGHAHASVGFCHVERGCKLVVTDIHALNGITQAQNGTVYVGNYVYGGISVFEQQEDDTLVLTDFIQTDAPLDNLSIDDNEALWAAGFPKAMQILQHSYNPESVSSASVAIRIATNTGTSSFYGEKYQVETVFEDDGSLASGITSVVYDVQRRKLYLHGSGAPRLVICDI